MGRQACIVNWFCSSYLYFLIKLIYFFLTFNSLVDRYPHLVYVYVKAVKYETQKPSTCCATLFRCKFLSMFPVFHLA